MRSANRTTPGLPERQGNTRVDYDHDQNRHTVAGAKKALTKLLCGRPPRSLLDIGCGTGTWLRAALELGVCEVRGIDGVPIAEAELLIPGEMFQTVDLSRPIDLGKKFDMVLCLEVAEHLPAESASALIASLVAHSDVILFSAAAPGQIGQHHVNCQWPDYWQTLFNEHGYVCNDGVRWDIWDISDIEPWYRQNLFEARRAPEIAGNERRLCSVIHPDMLQIRCFETFNEAEREAHERIENGSKPAYWYASAFAKALAAKACRRLRSRRLAEC